MLFGIELREKKMNSLNLETFVDSYSIFYLAEAVGQEMPNTPTFGIQQQLCLSYFLWL